jgi:hypothetical protein
MEGGSYDQARELLLFAAVTGQPAEVREEALTEPILVLNKLRRQNRIAE